MSDLNNQDQDYIGTEGIPVERPDQPVGPGVRGLLPQGGWGGDTATPRPDSAAPAPAIPDQNDDGVTPREKAGGAPRGPLDSGMTDTQRGGLAYGTAGREYEQNHPENVAKYLTMALNHMPDGMDVTVAPGDGGNYNVMLSKDGRRLDAIPISQGAMEQFLKTPASGFDAVYERGAQNIFRQLAQNGNAQTSQEAYLDKYPIYKAPKDVDQSTWERAARATGGYDPTKQEGFVDKQRAQDIEETKAESTNRRNDATIDQARRKNDLEEKNIASKERIAKGNQKARMLQYNNDDAAVARANKVLGDEEGGGNQPAPKPAGNKPAAQAAGKAPPGAAVFQNGHYFDKNGNLIQ